MRGGGADGAPPETAGPPHCARPGAVVAAALAAAELVLAALLFLQASRLILLLSLSGRFLPRLGRMLAASTTGAAGVAVLQYKLVSTFPPTVLYTNIHMFVCKHDEIMGCVKADVLSICQFDFILICT